MGRRISRPIGIPTENESSSRRTWLIRRTAAILICTSSTKTALASSASPTPPISTPSPCSLPTASGSCGPPIVTAKPRMRPTCSSPIGPNDTFGQLHFPQTRSLEPDKNVGILPEIDVLLFSGQFFFNEWHTVPGVNESVPEHFKGAVRSSGSRLLHSYLVVVTSLLAGEAARCSARLSCSTCWVHSAISSSISLISRAR